MANGGIDVMFPQSTDAAFDSGTAQLQQALDNFVLTDPTMPLFDAMAQLDAMGVPTMLQSEDEDMAQIDSLLSTIWSDVWQPPGGMSPVSAVSTTSVTRLHHPAAVPLRPQCQYIFIDNGNVFVGAQSLANGQMDLAIRVNVRELAELIQSDMPCMVKEVAASRPSNPRICSAWKKINYHVRKDSPAVSARQALCDSIQRTLLSYDKSYGPQTLVLATGDGTQFPHLVEVAISLGWNVIIWSWSRCLSEKFKKVRAMYPLQITIKLFDEFRNTITFRAPDRTSPPSSPPIQAAAKASTAHLQQGAPQQGAPRSGQQRKYRRHPSANRKVSSQASSSHSS